MSIFDKMINGLNNSTEKKEFCTRVNNLAFIYKETHKVLSPINNIYWCFNLNLNYEEPFSRQDLLVIFTTFSAYISQIISAHKELNELFNSNHSISSGCVNEYNKANKLCTTMISDLATLIKNYKTMNRVSYSERNRFILEHLEIELAKLEDFAKNTEQSKNIIVI